MRIYVLHKQNHLKKNMHLHEDLVSSNQAPFWNLLSWSLIEINAVQQMASKHVAGVRNMHLHALKIHSKLCQIMPKCGFVSDMGKHVKV